MQTSLNIYFIKKSANTSKTTNFTKKYKNKEKAHVMQSSKKLQKSAIGFMVASTITFILTVCFCLYKIDHNPAQEYPMAVVQRLHKNTGLTLPNKNGKYLYYAKTKNRSFVKNIKRAVHYWHRKTGIVMQPTTNRQNAQLIFKDYKGYIPKVKTNNSKLVAIGNTQMSFDTPNKHVFIQISHEAEDISSTNEVDALTHEIGHAMGLPHNKNPYSIMHYLLTSNQTLTKRDVALAKSNYKMAYQLENQEQNKN